MKNGTGKQSRPTIKLATVYAQARFPVSSLNAQKKINAKETYNSENNTNLVVLFKSLIFDNNIFMSNTTFYNKKQIKI